MEIQLLDNGNKVMLIEVLNDLSQNPKTLPCKYFYDEKGSELFEQICELDEYYLTRTEVEIMKAYGYDMAKTLGDNYTIIELGCGNSDKIKLLFDHLIPTSYVAVDISKSALAQFVKSLQSKFPKLNIVPICADYTKEFIIPDSNTKKIVYYPGSNIGNFNKSETFKILKIIHNIVGKDGGLLIGIDLKKDKATLENAYNDKKGITAEFNLNILNHINHHLDSNFDINNFEHKAIYNEKQGQIEMYLVSKCKQQVKINDKTILFDENEPVLTEISKKYNINEFKETVKDFFIVEKVWTDKNNKFGILFLRAK